ncbi:double-strand break repair protein AddB [Acuticoccus sp. MNP-M23]|uniref:double-strand break repair protein AddB n=1 Tax=Acuticoccus sp. MNP-M23 TaxID=3072793 RepID=UPI0028166B0D|nr:double-strand break repair protein AddB [Acuticoccus sp. MNP-M23]WMS44213.1 double-strand break repair protein AddB [Acuticoccus sp. MNP-M23]
MRVFSVDAGDPFLETLAARLTDGTLWPDGKAPDNPFAMASATVYLPTRRAARALAEAFLDVAGKPSVLPRIEALGETDDETLDTPATVGTLEGRVALASLVRVFARRLTVDGEPDSRTLLPSSGADAVRLADDLMALMDQVETQEADWADLPGLVERADLASHWKLTTDFLSIATEAWPAHLAANGKITEGAARRLEAEAAATAVGNAAGPMIVAGSTGSIPATRRLIRAIARSPFGAVVLPAFDRNATAEDWAALEDAPDASGHPQYGLGQLLEALGCAPGDVARLTPTRATATPSRIALVNASLRPAPATGRWTADRTAIDIPAALENVAMVEAEDERTEAAAVALAMREAVERGETVALVTPHRPLARRVCHALRRWSIAVDDSAGEPLTATPAGVFARLVAAVTAGGSAAEWLALLKHPLAFAGADRPGIEGIEALLRGPRIGPGRMAAALAARGNADAQRLGTAVLSALAPLAQLGRGVTVGALAAAHAEAVIAAAGEPPNGADWQAVIDTLATLAERTELAIDSGDWPSTFEALVSGIVVRGPEDDAAVRILGPLEARLQAFDHAILGGLNEGTWPAVPETGPWMSRGMMTAFGIDLPERKIGLSAHDYMVAAGARRLTLTRARKAGGAPTIASRWWQRLTAVAGAPAAKALARGARLVHLAALADTHADRPPAPRPAPVPPLGARPTAIAVTDVARLVRDPYAFYAKRILKLRPLDPMEADPSFGERGELIHTVLAEFMRTGAYREADAEARFRALVETALAPLAYAPDAQALWGARLAYIAPHVVAAEEARIGAWTPRLIEDSAGANIDGIRLHGRIDRIDEGEDGQLEIIDYKSGRAPTAAQVASLLEPQLPLEAVLVREGAMDFSPDSPIDGLTYVAIGQGRTPVAWQRMEPKGKTTETMVEDAMAAFRALVAHYGDPATGYLSRARIPFEADSDGDYDHLARVSEWQG